jgi:hypothetical protein
MKTIVNKTTGKVLYSTGIITDILDNETTIDEILTENFDNPHYNFETKQFYNKVEV